LFANEIYIFERAERFSEDRHVVEEAAAFFHSPHQPLDGSFGVAPGRATGS